MEGHFVLVLGLRSPVCERSMPCSACAERRLTAYTEHLANPQVCRSTHSNLPLDEGFLDNRSLILCLVHSWSLVSDCGMSCIAA